MLKQFFLKSNFLKYYQLRHSQKEDIYKEQLNIAQKGLDAKCEKLRKIEHAEADILHLRKKLAQCEENRYIRFGAWRQMVARLRPEEKVEDLWAD